MSGKKKRCKIEKTPVFLDFKGANKIMAQRGVIKNEKINAQDTGFSTVTIGQWGKEAPEVVTMLYHFLKDNMISFEDFVKEIQTNGK